MFASNIKVLLVDDNVQFAKIVSYLLADIGCQKLSTCSNAEEAWRRFRANPPDVCLLDAASSLMIFCPTWT